MSARIDIVTRTTRVGNKHVFVNDTITVVPEEGEPIDISDLVRAHTLTSEVGEARLLTLGLFANGNYTTEEDA